MGGNGYSAASSQPHLKSQHPEEVFSPVGEPTFRFRPKPSEGTVCKRSDHGTAAKVSLAENRRGPLTNNQGAKSGRVAIAYTGARELRQGREEVVRWRGRCCNRNNNAKHSAYLTGDLARMHPRRNKPAALDGTWNGRLRAG